MSDQGLPPPPGEDPGYTDRVVPSDEEPKRSSRWWWGILFLLPVLLVLLTVAALAIGDESASAPPPSPTPPPIIFHTVRIDGDNMAEVFARMAPCNPVATFRSGDGMSPKKLDAAIAAQIHAYGVQGVEDIHSAIHVVGGHTYWVVAGVACH